MDMFIHFFILVLALVLFAMAGYDAKDVPERFIAWGLFLWLLSAVFRI